MTDEQYDSEKDVAKIRELCRDTLVWSLGAGRQIRRLKLNEPADVYIGALGKIGINEVHAAHLIKLAHTFDEYRKTLSETQSLDRLIAEGEHVRVFGFQLAYEYPFPHLTTQPGEHP